MDKLNRSKRAVKGTITKLETFVEESSNHTPTKLDIKLKRVQEMNKKMDELKDQYYETKDISDAELAEIEADLQEMEDRLEDLEAKLLLQKLWVLKLEWDEPLSNPIAKEWNDFVSTLPVIQNIHIPRLVLRNGRIILHGFGDVSTAAYGAVLYVQSISEEDVSSTLLCRKSRVASVKLITIPRLELCACVLLAQLLEKVLHSLTLPIQQIKLWTESNIVLAWIQRSPEQLKTFIGNRFKIIQRLTKNCQWNHVSSNDNPADLISRGLNFSDISFKQLWWYGPDFLKEERSVNPIDFEMIISDRDYLKELKPPADVLLTSCKFSLIDDLLKCSKTILNCCIF
ncbi:integrase catalytic domain-containing protein [Trichonephila clavata]|uniref:Integrase catalytic domain-containing protein n=1 Tax=Trichonephila clavata TaxID=2740835 RepID=A0A8X6FZW7_TRICU|nr:integrase catalytic domain-containing protein [Trichonephila clavata]